MPVSALYIIGILDNVSKLYHTSEIIVKCAATRQLSGLITLSGTILTIHIDDLELMETGIEQPTHSFALLTRQCSAAFSAISLIDHFRDEFLTEDYSLTQYIIFHKR